jgi:hypothetical protein
LATAKHVAADDEPLISVDRKTWADDAFPPARCRMPLACCASDMAVTSPGMADKHCIRSFGIQRAPGFIGDGYIAQSCANVKRHRAVTKMQKLASTRRQAGMPSAGGRVVGSLHVIFRSFALHHEDLRSPVRCPLRDHIVTEVTWHRGFPVAGPNGRS